jgi:Zn-dependent protease
VDADVLKTIGIIGGLIFSVAFHESAHAWTAYRLGDPTGKLLGRITLNPIPHIDPFGTLLLPIALYMLTDGRFTFGYAKPVPYDPRYLKHPALGSALISAAGPISNLLLCIVFVFVAVGLHQHTELGGTVGYDVVVAVALVNVGLALFNLVPIPPLDGSGVLALFLPPPMRRSYLAIGAFGFILVLLLMRVPAFARWFDQAQLAVLGTFAKAARAILG